jgi:hypothetical protein
MLRFADAAFANDTRNVWHVLALGAGVAGTCVLIGPLIEWTKRPWRRVLSTLIEGRSRTRLRPAV